MFYAQDLDMSGLEKSEIGATTLRGTRSVPCLGKRVVIYVIRRD